MSVDERTLLQAQCQDARAALTAAGIGEGETLADGISELVSRIADVGLALADARTEIAVTRRAGGAAALRMVAREWRGDHVASAAAVADDLDRFAAELEKGAKLP